VKYESLWIGMLVGAALGFAIGVTTADKPFTGLLIGVAVGALVGLAARKDPSKG
jgi:gas vesicle protein